MAYKKTFSTTQCQWRTCGSTRSCQIGLLLPVLHCKTFRSHRLLCPPMATALSGGKGDRVPSGFGSLFGCLGGISLRTHLVCAAILRRQGARGAGLPVFWTSLSLLGGWFRLLTSWCRSPWAELPLRACLAWRMIGPGSDRHLPFLYARPLAKKYVGRWSSHFVEARQNNVLLQITQDTTVSLKAIWSEMWEDTVSFLWMKTKTLLAPFTRSSYCSPAYHSSGAGSHPCHRKVPSPV